MSKVSRSLSEIVDELRTLCREARTGTLLVATDDNRLLQVGLEKGEIVQLVYAGNRTADVLPLLLEIKSGNSRFKEGPIPAFRTDLPPTAKILSHLGRPGEARAADAALPMQTLADLEKLLCEFVGPMASVLFAEKIRGARDFGSVVQALAKEIPSPDMATMFRARAKELAAETT